VAALFHLLLSEYCGGQFDALTARGDSRAQKQCAQVLFDGSWTDVEASGDFLVAAALGEKSEDLFVAGRDLDGIQIDHCDYLLGLYERHRN
jgi:hypothetical protein